VHFFDIILRLRRKVVQNGRPDTEKKGAHKPVKAGTGHAAAQTLIRKVHKESRNSLCRQSMFLILKEGPDQLTGNEAI
jgi:hypothetical protein